MCGLYGGVSISFLTHTELERVRQLGVLSQLRGVDSSGILVVSKKKNKKINYEYRKRVKPPGEFLETHEAKSLMYASNSFCVVGHSRKATCGEINETNAQPLQDGKIIGVHNGVIEHFQPAKAFEKERTDSKGLIERINEKGVVSAIDEVGDGAYAIVYVDMQSRTLNFARNYKRPLFMMWDRDKTCLYWASEREMLEFLKSREGSHNFLPPESFDTNTLYTMALGSLSFNRTKLPFRPAGQTVFHPLALPPPKKAESTSHTKSGGTNTVLTKEGVPVESVFCKRCQKELQYCFCSMHPSVPIIDRADRRLYKGWKGAFQPVKDIIDILQYGCSTCGITQTPDYGVMWISPSKIVCQQCLKDKAVFQYIRSTANQMFLGAVYQARAENNVYH